IDGPAKDADSFLKKLSDELPPKARLEGVLVVSRVAIHKREAAGVFEILESSADDSMRISIPADLAMCEDCRNEVFNPDSRYYRYPFTTCTNCGPRYTVVESMPYDRERTALKEFPLCADCLSEYTNPLDRRFHAESIACAGCGPQLEWADSHGNPLSVEDPLIQARLAISRGKIVAVRGLGGFLLAADATDKGVLERLREIKNRPAKPFAVMARNLELVKDNCYISETEEKLLCSSESPIVVLRTRIDCDLPLDILTPGLSNLGVMLPTTPLHALLAEKTGNDPTDSFDFLLMTSGNRSGEPICITNQDAFQRLKGIADFFLFHNRGINLRNDDSLAVVDRGSIQLWRRARGYAPESIKLKHSLERTVLAMGAELKNTICLGFDNEAVISPHIGNLETPEALDGLEQVVNNFPVYFSRTPEVIAIDPHPDMHSSRLGRKIAKRFNIPVVEIQHHYAHAMSVMCEHGLEEAIALVFDGTGLGTDGTVWGGELLHVSKDGWKRLGTLAPAELLGGDAAVHRPARQLAARFWQQGLEIDERWRRRLAVSEYELALWKMQYEKQLNSFTSHAAGRVFDAFSTGLAISPEQVSYEGQAAIWLEDYALRSRSGNLPDLDFKTSDSGGLFVVDLAPMFLSLYKEFPEKNEASEWAWAFHNTMVKAALAMVESALLKTAALPVVLSGGVMMNRFFVSGLVGELRKREIEVYTHSLVPPNDGGISLGQVYAVYATRRIK
ncbi:MAG: carbamoyltransferase HypF, partial [Candidatus Fermentibacteria bacterium]|nr:carbamoyltransferase HypF [Candidatus Fermentibacteria bacterium]